mgnify:CR=1 FL=1
MIILVSDRKIFGDGKVCFVIVLEITYFVNTLYKGS